MDDLEHRKAHAPESCESDSHFCRQMERSSVIWRSERPHITSTLVIEGGEGEQEME